DRRSRRRPTPRRRARAADPGRATFTMGRRRPPRDHRSRRRGPRRADGLAGGRAREVLAQRLVLTLVVRPDALAVQTRGRFEHVLERELADALAVLDHERNVVRAHLERRARSDWAPAGIEPE